MRACRLLAAILILGLAALLAFFADVAGSFSCYDCSARPLQPIFDGAAVVILVVGVLLAARVAFGGRRPKSPGPDSIGS